MFNDLRHAIRGLLRTPGFTAAAVLTLALGIGANTAIFAVVNAVLLEPLGYPQSDRLVSIVQRHERSGSPEFATLPDFEDWRTGSTQLQHVGGAWGVTFNLTAIEEPERLRGALVTASLFPAFGTPPALGRAFTDAEQNERVVVLSHTLWQRRFGGDRAVLGRSVALNGRPYTVVGVDARRIRVSRSDHRTMGAARAGTRNEQGISPVECRWTAPAWCDGRAGSSRADSHCGALGGRVPGVQQGLGRRREVAAGRRSRVHQPAAVDSYRRCCVRAADRVRKSRKSAAVARHRARTRNVDQSGAWGRSRTTHPSTSG